MSTPDPLPPGTVACKASGTAARRAIEHWTLPVNKPVRDGRFRTVWARLCDSRPRAGAALEFAFPEQHKFLFAGDPKPAKGREAILTVSTFLDRLDALESGKDRKATHKVDLDALKRLAERGITVAERKRLRDLLQQVRDGVSMPEVAAPVADGPSADSLALYRWHREWAATARAVTHRRDQLISLGLAERKKRKQAEPPAPQAPAPAK